MTVPATTGEGRARAITAEVLGRDPGPLTAADSLSHQVFVGPDVVIKIIDAGGHTRLGREIALAPHLPAGITAPLLSSGVHNEVRYACYARMPGTSPGMGLPGVDAATARVLAEQAVHRLDALHRWVPPSHAAPILSEPLDHGGFAGRAALFELLDDLAAADREKVVPLGGLTAVAQNAPERAGVAVPVHADCHWGNWLAAENQLTALLDFEWARFGEPLDDWFFVIGLSGPHLKTVLDVVARETGISPDTLRAACEVRHAAYLASDLLLALLQADDDMLAARLSGLQELEHQWR